MLDGPCYINLETTQYGGISVKHKITVINESEIKSKHKHIHDPYEYYKKEVTIDHNSDQCYVAFYEIPPMKSNYPYHYHEENTEVFYIIKGNGVLRTEDGPILIKAGDTIVSPPGKHGVHKITNTSQDNMLKYFEVDTTNSPDIVHYPDSDKLGIMKHNEVSSFYKNNAAIDYYDGE